MNTSRSFEPNSRTSSFFLPCPSRTAPVPLSRLLTHPTWPPRIFHFRTFPSVARIGTWDSSRRSAMVFHATDGIPRPQPLSSGRWYPGVECCAGQRILGHGDSGVISPSSDRRPCGRACAWLKRTGCGMPPLNSSSAHPENDGLGLALANVFRVLQQCGPMKSERRSIASPGAVYPSSINKQSAESAGTEPKRRCHQQRATEVHVAKHVQGHQDQ